jgi:hypothetical protein
MSSMDARHLENDLLLQFLDGELSMRKARQVRKHVEACWQCRAELAELHRLVTECVRYRNQVAEATSPPPRSWADLSLEMSRLDDAAPHTGLFQRSALRWALLGAGAASLVAATLALRVIDFRTGSEQKPVQSNPAPKTVLPEQPLSPAGTSTRADGAKPSVSGRAVVPEPTAPSPQASVSDELRAVAVLHRLGADLGEPIEVAMNGGYIVVGGIGVSPERQQQIRDALRSQPTVILQFSDPSSSPTPAAPASKGSAPFRNASPQTTNPLEAQVGGRAQLEQLSTQLLDHDDAAMARVYALRRLAEQFPPEAERQLNSNDEGLLKDLGRQHVEVLSRETMAIDALASPVLAPPIGSTSEPATAVESWQSAVRILFVSARQVETLLPAWLGVTARDGASPANMNLAQQLSAALARLQSDVQQCERLLKP